MGSDPKFTVGQTVWFYKPGYGRSKGTLHELTISKVGRKYLTVGTGTYPTYQVDIGTLREVSDYNYNGRLYTTKEEYELEIEGNRLREKLRDYFGNIRHKGMSLQDLARIEYIIDNPNT
jgi:hypothetical protein